MLKQLFVLISLSLSVPACQTPHGETADRQGTKESLLDSQKALVREALDSGRPQVALQTIRPLLRSHPDDASVQGLMGLTQLALRNAGRAVRYLQTAYKLDKRTGTGLNLSAAYIETGELEKAKTLLKSLKQRARTENYASPERIFQNLGIIAIKQKRNTQAESYFQEAIEENPTFHPAHLELGRLYDRTLRPALAIKSYRAALDFCQTCYAPLEALTNRYIKAGRYTDARLTLARFVQNDNVAPEDKTKAQQLLKVATAAATQAKGTAPARR